MTFDATHHHRRSIRLAGYDYRAAGAYFVTICAAQKRCVFGKIEGGAVRLHPYGRVVAEEWERTADVRANVMLDEWIVMPNHFHGILVFTHDATVGATRRVAPTTVAPTLYGGSLGAVVGQFKSIVTKRLNAHRAERGLAPVVVWQRGYYERIIRNEKELDDTRRYIYENPLRWLCDTENPA